jgi:hypothetical protein
MDDEVVLGELFRSASLASIVNFHLCEPKQVVVVRVYRYLLAQPLKHVAVVFQQIHYCQQLLVVDLLVQLGGSKLAAVVGDRVQQTVIAVLRDNCSEGKVRGISFEDYWLCLVEMAEDRCLGERVPEVIEGPLRFPIPNEPPHQVLLLQQPG